MESLKKWGSALYWKIWIWILVRKGIKRREGESTPPLKWKALTKMWRSGGRVKAGVKAGAVAGSGGEWRRAEASGGVEESG